MEFVSKRRLRWKYCLEKLYDAVVCIFSVLDVFFDILVTYQFYIEGHIYFFSISLFILFAAQISYSVFMCCALEPIERKNTFIDKYNVLIFFICLPFAQIIPLFLMLYTSYPGFFNKYLIKYGYRFQFSLNNIDLFNAGDSNGNSPSHKNLSSYDHVRYLNDIEFDEDSFNKNQIRMNDPFSNFIRRKLISHFGFIIEAVIESIPQSILQMIYLIMYSSLSSSSSFSTINILSIIMSMTVVSSKGTLLSYSIYRKASIFNFLCFAIDIFGIFTICSWLFVLNDNNGNYEFFGYHLWYIGYFYFDMLYYIYLILIWIAFWAFNLLLIESYKTYWNCPWRNSVQLILLPIGAILLIIPVSLIILTIRFTLIPLFILGVFDHSQNRSYGYYNKIYSFIAESESLKQIHDKILITNWILSEIINETDLYDLNVMGYSLIEQHQYDVAKNISKQMKQQYNHNGNVSLSHLYGILSYYDYNYWTHYKYHQLFEVISLLITKKDFWKFILIKISPDIPSKYYLYCIKILFCCCWSTHDIDNTFLYDKDKYNKLEIEFWSTIKQIQDIIKWKDFMIMFIRNWNQFLIHLNIIRQWFHNLNWRILAINIYNTSLVLFTLFAIWFWRVIICNKIPTFIKWFCGGLYFAILQDLTNLYYTFMRCYDKWIYDKHDRYKNNQTMRSALTLNEHIDYLQDPKLLKIYRNKQILKWNIPKCWDGYNALFKNSILRTDQSSYIYFSNISDYRYNQPWIGRGIFVFIIVIIFKCIHCPLRDLFTWRTYEDFCVVMIGIPALLIILPLVLCIAIYSIFVPILFIIQHWIYFGIFNFNDNLLQIIFTFCYIIILIAIFILLPKVWKFVYSDFHLFRYFTDKTPTPQLFANHVIKVYESKEIRDNLIDNCFGNDLGGIIKAYLPKYQIFGQKK